MWAMVSPMELTNLSQLPAIAVMEASPDGLVLCDDTGVISEVLHVNLRGGSKASAIDSRTSIHPTVA